MTRAHKLVSSMFAVAFVLLVWSVWVPRLWSPAMLLIIVGLVGALIGLALERHGARS